MRYARDTATDQDTGGQICGQTKCGEGAEAVLASTRFKLVTRSIGFDASDGRELTMKNLRKW